MRGSVTMRPHLVLTGGNTEMEEETSPYTKEQLEDGTLEYARSHGGSRATTARI